MKQLKKILVLGSGAIKIGEAGEFDYSGSQCLKALKEEGIKTVLINPNIATIQTSENMADSIYFLPITAYFVEKVIQKEKPEGIMLGFGGQTALNCGLSLAQKGILKKYDVKVLGTPIKAIADTEDRQLFVKCLKEIGLKTPKSKAVGNLKQAKKAVEKIGFPAILRVGFALGGLGSKLVKNYPQFENAIAKALSGSPQVLIEEYLGGWKEIEYEVVRDRFDNCITVCNMENLDPMGIHTGESIVVAPTQTLTDFEWQKLREISIKLIRHLGIVGECNIQFALNPEKFEYRIIEVNARLSRSSALASKATGYPLAFVAAKLALGYSLFELENKITKKTTAFFEPALDYIALKFPRWDLGKFINAGETIGPEMKSVGEVMALDRNFPAALQKAVRMLNIGEDGLFNGISNELKNRSEKELLKALRTATPSRLFIVAAALSKGIELKKINKLTGIDPWFLNQINDLVKYHKSKVKLSPESVREGKLLGFSDDYLSGKFNNDKITDYRLKNNITPVIKQIDTVAAEFPAKTNYLYLTYNGNKDDIGINKSKKKRVLIVGSGPYCIGSSVEFDWCVVNAAWELNKKGFETIMVNCNPETVSTDFDIGSKLYFEELTYERIADICDKEKPDYLLLSFGGQIPSNLAKKLQKLGVPILGTAVSDIDRAEDRNKFLNLLDNLQIKQPPWKSFSNQKQAFLYAEKIGFPVLVRPSYVLSGAAMFVAYHQQDLKEFLQRSLKVTRKYPLVITKFMENCHEVDIDGVGQKGKVVALAISEHIENAGVHSGDSTMIFPSQNLELRIISKLKIATQKIVKTLNITGPFNIQYIVKNGDIYVIECNLRASRSFPFVSKISGINFAKLAVKVMFNGKIRNHGLIRPDVIGVKSPQFSFTRIQGADPVLRVEMASTGETGCLGSDLYDAFLKSLLSTGFKLPEKSILLSLGGMQNKEDFLLSAKLLAKKFILYATKNTYNFLRNNNIKARLVYKVNENKKPNVVDLIKSKKAGLVIIVSNSQDLKRQELKKEITDGYLIRRAAADFNTPLITNLEKAIIFTKAFSKKPLEKLEIKEWKEYI